MKKIIVFSLFFSLILTGCSLSEMGKSEEILTIEEAQAEAEEFINENLMNPGSTANIVEISEEGSLYKIMVDVGAEENVESYISKDGKKFFPSVFDVEEIEKQVAEQQPAEGASQPQANVELEKRAKPDVELFVMSHCPFGTQIEKGILPVLDLLGDKINFELKFCDYAMHDKVELDEQLNQYCIQKNEPNKLLPYLECFLADGESESCLDSVGINQSQLDSCVSATDKEYKVTEQYNDKNTWRGGRYPVFDVYADDNAKYGIGGSPALVINGKQISSGRDSASLLNTICGAFTEAPEECNESLSSTSPSSGFGFNNSGSASTATCN